MSCHARHNRSRQKGALALLLVLFSLPVLAASSSDVLIVELFLNHENMGTTFVLKDEAGRFYIEEAILKKWRIVKPWPTPVAYGGKNYYVINEFSGATAELQSRSMELDVTMPPSLMPLNSITMERPGIAARSAEVGAYMDYELNWLQESSGHSQSLYGLFRPVLFGRRGNISSNLLYRRHRGRDAAATTNARSGITVLDLTYTLDDPSRVRSFRAGDIITAAGSQGRALRIGGIQLATNFSTRPTMVTYPLPDFYGQTEVPTALDVYINGRLTRTERVRPGPYVLENVPVVNGAGQLQVVTRDALGRQQVFSQDYYLSPDLLQQGLNDYSFSLGAIRQDYGLENFSYGDVAALATWRHGLRNNLTLEGHAELSDGLAVLGGASQYAVRQGGTISAGLGISTGKGDTGLHWQAGFRRSGRLLNYNIEAGGATQHFSLVGESRPQPKLQLAGTASRNFASIGSLGLAIVVQELRDSANNTIVSANHSKTFRNRLSLFSFVSLSKTDSSDLSIGIQFAMPFGEAHSVSSGVSFSDSHARYDAGFRRNLPAGTGFGYYVDASHSGDSYVNAGVIAQNELGTLSIDVTDSNAGGSLWQVGSRGSIAYLAGMTSLTREVQDAFAVVNVGNLPNIRVYAENQEIGRTNDNGQLFVPRLRPYQNNKLRIELNDIPLNAAIGSSQIEAAPYFRSGIVVNFDVGVATNVLLRAVRPDGSPLPEGAIASVLHSGDVFPVGLDGKLYLQRIDRSSQIEIQWNGTSCELQVPYPGGGDVITKMGDIVCQPRAEK